ncbi:GntR family transcriptional regulator [Neobacillus cucumis]|uniref:GntR family transcriptional regulator n=1 Tax=Neobacillus cucumis TaxID=1740721 RepID=A0A2N5H6B5_9BACI|nr:GntR family transcriptional regulator [Neobacillus cucumis]PLS01046.1 GntR family transcriptional regulator [Neobacillus cucumis]
MAQKTKYNMVKEKITEWITSGQVGPGEKIYSENELVKKFGVSRHTIRQAIGDLVHEGWLYREQGAGTFCSGQRLHHKLPENKTQNTNRKNIGVITTYISDYIFPSIIKGIESYLTEQGYSLTFACTDNDIEKEKQCLQSMLSRNIDGLIVEPTKSGSFNPNINFFLELEQNKIPYLMINQFYPQLVPPHIIVNDQKGGFLAAEHLIELGHHKIIGIFKADDLQGIYRMQGFIEAHRENNIPLSAEMMINYSTEEQNDVLIDKVRKLLSTSEEMPTGIICYNDQIAVSVLNCLRELGLSVPGDISIVGFDDSFLAEATELTSVTHPKIELGIQAAKWIVSAVENRNQEGNEPQATVFEPELVIRNSSSFLKNDCIVS